MRILFVAFPDSSHTARWIEQVSDQGWELHLAPTNLFPPHTRLPRNVTVHMPRNQRILSGRRLAIKALNSWPHLASRGYAQRLLARLDATSPAHLVQTIRNVQPDMIHSMVIQHAGYTTLAARQQMRAAFPTWIVSNWGSSLYLFGRLAKHKDRIKAVLAACDYYTCECERDVGLARQFGFTGHLLPAIPAAGGFNMTEAQKFRQPGPPSKRRIILLKGYQNWAGRALAGLRAIELCADLLQGYRVVIQLASPDVEIAAELVSQATGIPIEIATHGDYMQAIRRFGSARIHIGLSISDGISQSLLESMVMGAFPIQSNTACANEWIEDGKSGFIVPPEDPHLIAAALRRAITDDALVDQAAQINEETVRQRLDSARVKQQTIALYQSVLGNR